MPSWKPCKYILEDIFSGEELLQNSTNQNKTPQNQNQIDSLHLQTPLTEEKKKKEKIMEKSKLPTVAY